MAAIPVHQNKNLDEFNKVRNAILENQETGYKSGYERKLDDIAQAKEAAYQANKSREEKLVEDSEYKQKHPDYMNTFEYKNGSPMKRATEYAQSINGKGQIGGVSEFADQFTGSLSSFGLTELSDDNMLQLQNIYYDTTNQIWRSQI